MRTTFRWGLGLLMLLPALLRGADLPVQSRGLPGIQAYAKIRPGSYRKVTAQTFAAGHARIQLLEGVAAPLEGEGPGRGIHFKGKGRLVYRSENVAEFPLVRTNLARHGRNRVTVKEGEGVLEVAVDFREASLWYDGLPDPVLGEEEGGEAGASFPDHWKRFLELARPSVAQDLAAHRLNDPGQPFLRVDLVEEGFRGDALTYGYGPREETLCLDPRRALADEDWTYTVPLSRQSFRGDRPSAPSPDFTLTDVDLDFTATAGDDASYLATETFLPSRPLNALVLDLLSWHYGDSRDDVRSFRVRQVLDGEGRELDFDHRWGQLLVALPGGRPAGVPFKLQFRVEGNILYRPHKDSYWQLGVTAWFPMPDLEGQAYTYHARIRVPGPYQPISCGTTVARGTEGKFNTLEVRIDKPIQFATLSAGKFRFTEEEKDGLKLRVATLYATELRVGKMMAAARRIVRYYERLLGPFPFREFNIIEQQGWGWGQAPPAVLFISTEAFEPAEVGDFSRWMTQGVNARFAHELAHQYWGHMVKMPSSQEQWLTESFAEYCAYLCTRDTASEDEACRILQQWKNEAAFAGTAAAIPSANELRSKDWIEGFRQRSGLLYAKGPLLLKAIHEEVGDRAFRTFLRSYQTTFRWKFAATPHVTGLLKHITGKDFGPFMDACFYGVEMPDAYLKAHPVPQGETP